MAKTPKKKPDTHKSGFMVRLPESYRTILSKLKAKNRRTITVEIQIALDKHAKDEGIPPVMIMSTMG